MTHYIRTSLHHRELWGRASSKKAYIFNNKWSWWVKTFNILSLHSSACVKKDMMHVTTLGFSSALFLFESVSNYNIVIFQKKHNVCLKKKGQEYNMQSGYSLWLIWISI